MRKVREGEIFDVRYILGETAWPLVEWTGYGYRAKCDILCVGELCRGGFFHLRQAIEIIPGRTITDQITIWPRLRKALHLAGVKPVNIPGGGYPLHYTSQLAIPDYAMSGAHYFIIERSDVGRYLKALPLDERGKKRRADFEARKRASEELE